MVRAEWAIVLAAGGSRRMGAPKALLPWGDRPLVAAHALALAPFAHRVAVVVGADAERVLAALPESVCVVRNPEWERTHPSDSARRAVRELDVRGTALITPVDVPPAPTSLLARLLATPAPARPVGPDGVPAHPVLLGPEEVAALRADVALPEGLRSLLASARAVPATADEVGADFDDPEAWARARR